MARQASKELKAERKKIAHQLKKQGLTNAQIGKQLRVDRSTVGQLLKDRDPFKMCDPND